MCRIPQQCPRPFNIKGCIIRCILHSCSWYKNKKYLAVYMLGILPRAFKPMKEGISSPRAWYSSSEELSCFGQYSDHVTLVGTYFLLQYINEFYPGYQSQWAGILISWCDPWEIILVWPWRELIMREYLSWKTAFCQTPAYLGMLNIPFWETTLFLEPFPTVFHGVFQGMDLVA